MLPVHVVQPVPVEQALGLLASVALPLLSATTGSGVLGLA